MESSHALASMVMMSPDCIFTSNLELDSSVASLMDADGPHGIDRERENAVRPLNVKFRCPEADCKISVHCPSAQLTCNEVKTASCRSFNMVT